MTPTALSLRHLRAEGWLVDVVERWVPGISGLKVRRDLFGIGDLLALRGPDVLLVQTTSAGNALSRVRKIGDGEHAEALAALRAAGVLVHVHGWRMTTADGKACKHGKARCGCRWRLHRFVDLSEEQP